VSGVLLGATACLALLLLPKYESTCKEETA